MAKLILGRVQESMEVIDSLQTPTEEDAGIMHSPENTVPNSSTRGGYCYKRRRDPPPPPSTTMLLGIRYLFDAISVFTSR